MQLWLKRCCPQKGSHFNAYDNAPITYISPGNKMLTEQKTFHNYSIITIKHCYKWTCMH